MLTRIRKTVFTFFLLICALQCSSLYAQDSLISKQELYNGRIWINRFLAIRGDQFLFSRSFLPGTVAVKGNAFPVNLRYDIYEDEVQIIAGHFGYLQVNKQLVDSFTLRFNNREYHFISVRNDTLPEPLYMNVLYKGELSVCALYQKKINRGGEGSAFYQSNRIFLVKEGAFKPVRSKSELISLLGDKQDIIKTWMRKNHVRVTAKDPQSFIPVISYYDGLMTQH